MRKTIVLALCCALAAVTLTAETVEKKKVVIRPAQVGAVPFVWEGDEGVEVFVQDFMGARSFLGVTTLHLSDELRANFGVARDTGVMINTVGADSPAAKAGLKAGDIIIAVDGKKVESPASLSRAIRERGEGDQVRIDFRRNGTNHQAVATLVKREGFAVPGFRFDPDSIREPIVIAGEAVKDIEKYFNSPEWKAKMENFQDCSKVQTRVKDLEKRLADLEKRLNEK